jgi:uncharacterized caspase-like protein
LTFPAVALILPTLPSLLNAAEMRDAKMVRSILLMAGMLSALAGCTTPPDRPQEASPGQSSVQAYKRLSLAVVEPPKTEERFDAGIVEDMTKILVAQFGSVTVAKSLEEARAGKPDLIASLSVDSDPSTHIVAAARIDVHVRFVLPDNRVIEELHVYGRQHPRPFLLPHEVNESARERTREQMQRALRESAKLATFAQSPQIAAQSGPRLAQRLQSDVDAPAYRLKENPNAFALIVGIEQYADLPDARFASRDAEAVRQHLIAMGYPERNVVSLSAEKATRAGMQKYLSEWLPRNVTPESTLFFYYSGHGAPDTKTGEAYLVPWDGDPKFLATTAYPLKELYAALEKLRVKEIIVVLDSCFSGAGGRSVLAKGARPMVITVEAGFLPSGNMTFFGAAARDEISGGLDEQGHGLFTYYFLKGLSGAAKDASGAVTLKGLYNYLKPLVQDEARRQNRDQTPVLHGLQQDRLLVRFE